MNDRELKYQISVRLLQHMAEAEGMTVAEYGQVYDSEKHERLLNDLMRLIPAAPTGPDSPAAEEAP